MTTQELQTLYEFNSWANARTLETVATLGRAEYERDLGSSHGGIHGTLVHAMGAEDIWLRRWNGKSPASFYAAADFASFDAVRLRWGAVDAELLAFARSLTTGADAERTVAYADLKGIAYSQALWQLMQHVVNHSTYHRGQVVTMLRQLGARPAATDLVAFYRRRAANE